MRELTKSLLSFSWAMSLFGGRQMTKILGSSCGSQPDAKAAFDSLRSAAQQQFEGGLLEAFQAGDDLQRRFVDMMSGVFGSGTTISNRIIRTTAEAARQAGTGFPPPAGRQDSQASTPRPGWGPVK
jgi:hypothetical protein